jgi:DNA-binding CsgD family transcriptional regulator
VRHQDYQDVADAGDMPTLENRLVRFAHEMGFGIISGYLVVEQGSGRAATFPFGNTPEAYQSTFMSASIGRRDPVMRRMKRLSVPFIYDQSIYVNEQAADLWDTMAPFGYKTGIALALHLPGGKHFAMGVDRDQALPGDDVVLARMMADLQLLAVHAQDTAIRLLAPQVHGVQLAPHPTGRELEVLRWTLAGKTAWEVGMLLGISERTAAIHANRATHKLGCVGKHQAALKAMQLGLI